MLGKKKKLPLHWLWIITSILTVIVSWSYGHSYIVYASVSIILMLFIYGMFFKKILEKCTKLDICVIVVILFNLLFSMFNGDIKSMLLVNISLLTMFSLECIEIDYEQYEQQIPKAAGVIFLMSLILSLTKDSWNSNSLAILLFCNGCIGFIWIKSADNALSKVLSVIFLIALSLLLFATDSRNTAIVIILCFLLLLLPQQVYQNKIIFRIIYLLAIATTIFAIPIMQFVFENEKILGNLIDFTTSVSDKTYGMSSHLDILLYVQKDFQKLELIQQIFGTGVKMHNCHNLFYQCLFTYGYLGTILIYGLYIYIFEMGYKLFTKYDNKLALCCCIILMGHFMMQCGEVYTHGLETSMVVAFIPAAVILNLNKSLESTQKEPQQKEIQER